MLALWILLLPAVRLPAQTPQKPEAHEQDDVVRVNSELVQTDVMVFDKQGKFVNGLRREDFDLRIDGKSRGIDFFERITAGSSNEDSQLSAARGLPTNAGKDGSGPVPLDRGRTVFFYVDDLHMKAGNLLQIRKLLLHFIDVNLGQNDLAAITSASGSVGFLQQLTENKAVLRAAVDRLSPRPTATHDIQRPPMTEWHAQLIDQEDRDVTDYFIDEVIKESGGQMPRDMAANIVKSRSREILQYADYTTKNTLVGLEGLVRSSGELSGRKLLIFVSDGFLLNARNSETISELRNITSAAARSGVVIYSMDARGLTTGMDDISSIGAFDPTGRLQRGSAGELTASQDGMNALAHDTGGRTIFNTNALDVGLTKAINETSIYYLLAWRPDPETSGDKFRKLTVNLIGHPDWTVRVRQGFFNHEVSPTKVLKEPKPAANAQAVTPDLMLRNSFRSIFPKKDLPVVTRLGFLLTPENKIMLTVSMQLSTDAMDFLQDGEQVKAQVDLRGTVFNDQGKAGATFSDHVTTTAASSERLKEARDELIYNYDVFVPPGIYQVRLGARDAASGKLGTSYEWISIPKLSDHKLAMSTAILAERPNAADGTTPVSTATPLARVRVDGRFHRNSILRFILYVYNAETSPLEGKPDLGLQVQVLRDQEPVVTTPSKKLSTEGLSQFDRVPYAGELSLQGFLPGRYVLQISVVDRVAKTTATQQVKLEVY